jgi:hypothetical protein
MVQAELGPVVGELMIADEYEHYIKRLQDAGTQPAFFLSSFTPDGLSGLLRYMADQLRISRMDNCSLGTLPADGSSKTESNSNKKARKPAKAKVSS